MEEKKVEMTVQKAAELMHASEQFIREGLKNKTLPFGFAVKNPSGKYSYWIGISKFEEFTGIKVKL